MKATPAKQAGPTVLIAVAVFLALSLSGLSARTIHLATFDKSVPLSRSAAAEAYGKLPMSFEINQGQTDPRVEFLSRGRGYPSEEGHEPPAQH